MRLGEQISSLSIQQETSDSPHLKLLGIGYIWTIQTPEQAQNI